MSYRMFFFETDFKKGDTSMAGIQWTSSSINNFFSTSLNQKNTGMNSLYGLLSDASLIKTGSYHKLMDAYVKQVKKQNAEKDSDSKTETSNSLYDKNGLKQTNPESILNELI